MVEGVPRRIFLGHEKDQAIIQKHTIQCPFSKGVSNEEKNALLKLRWRGKEKDVMVGTMRLLAGALMNVPQLLFDIHILWVCHTSRSSGRTRSARCQSTISTNGHTLSTGLFLGVNAGCQ